MTAPRSAGEPLVRYGFTAGAEGAGAIHAIGDADDESAPTAERSAPVTIAEALAALQRAGARFALAELPDRPALATLRHALEAAGFTEVGRVRDYMDDGTDLVLLRRNT